MSFYIVEHRLNFKTQKNVVKAFTSWSAKERIMKKFPTTNILSVKEMNQDGRNHSGLSDSNFVDDVLDTVTTAAIVESVFDLFDSDDSSSSGGSSVFDDIGSFASDISDTFDGGGSSGDW